MTDLAMFLFEGMNPAFGLFAFLSIGAVALFAVFLPVTTWLESRRKEREAYYRAETVRRLVESSGEGAKTAVELIREQDRIERVKKHEGLKIGGLVNIAVGVGLLIFLRMLIPTEAVYLCGLIPVLIGVALLVYVLFMAKPVE